MKKNAYKWLLVFCANKDFKLISETIIEHGFKVFGDRQIQDCDAHIINLTGPKQKVDRVGCVLVGLQMVYPRDLLDFVMVDSDGIF